jgi:flagellar M-ring protein FliF
VPAWLSALRDLVVDASPLRRFMLALLVVLPLAALAAAWLRFNAPAYQTLYAQLSDRAGGEVIAALEQLDIPYRLSPADGRIEVPADRLHAARYRLAARGLPRSDDAVTDAASDAPALGLTSAQVQQRQQRALELELARSVQALDSVELARVHLALPKVSPFLRDAPPVTAAVLVRLRPGTRLDTAQVTSIQTLVAASVPRLQREHVQVIDPHGVVLGVAEPAPAPSARAAVEHDLARRALAVLTPWLGEQVSVQVTATLDDSETVQTVERVRNVVVAGEARPLEKSVRTTRVPEGRVARVNAIVVLRLDAAPEDVRRAEQMARQALGLVRSRGDSLGVFVLPAAAPAQQSQAPAAPQAVAPAVIPQVRAAEPAAAARGVSVAIMGWGAGLAVLALAGFFLWRRREPAPSAPAEDELDAVLGSLRSEVLADPRIAADVVRLWMRA